MRRNVSIYLASLIFTLLAACAEVPMTSEALDQEAKKFTPQAGKGALYIHRHEIFGGRVALPVQVNGLSVGQTAASSYILLNLIPGLYSVESNSPENTAQIEVTIETGKNYFVWLEPKMGMWVGPRVALQLVDEKSGRQAVMDSKRIAVSIPESRFVPLGATQPQVSTEDFAATRLREIKKLRDEGIISEEEFQGKRKQLINQL
ncbi:MAG TPA: DUF2846 domain-containing protein [Azonexus sp.]|nr:DUF2846 domain-containing protein [Azonexus sp.]